MRRLLAPALATAVLAPAAILVAQQTPPAAAPKNPAAVTGGNYTVDPGHTLIQWRLDHLAINDYFGIFGDSTGTLSLDPKNPNAAKVDITIPISKVTTASAGLTEHLTRAGKDGGKPDFFGANAPDARFVSTKVEATGTKARITGNLTLLGVTRPVVLDAELSGVAPYRGKEAVGFHARTTINRADFGIGYGPPSLGKNVGLDITVAFLKA